MDNEMIIDGCPEDCEKTHYCLECDDVITCEQWTNYGVCSCCRSKDLYPYYAQNNDLSWPFHYE